MFNFKDKIADVWNKGKHHPAGFVLGILAMVLLGNVAYFSVAGKLGANVDHSTTTIHGGHSLVVPGDSLGGFMSGADKTKLDGVGATMKGTLDALVTTNIASLTGLASTQDGVALSVDGMSVGAFGQTTTTADGCYQVHSGAWTRCTELAVGSTATKGYYVVGTGTANKGVWYLAGGVVGTNDLVATNLVSAGGAVASVNGLTGTVVLTPANVASLQGMTVDAVTTSALPAYTAAGAGVGKTITLNASAACPTIDGLTPSTTPAIGSYASVLVQNGASFADNGPYAVTTSTGSSCVLTRDTRADTMTEILAGTVRVTQGTTRRGAIYEYCNDPSITLDTGAAAWMRTDAHRGPNEYAEFTDDFDRQTLVLTNGQSAGGPLQWFNSVVGTAAFSIRSATATERGVWRFSATSATGSVAFSLVTATPAINVATAQFFEQEVRLAGPSALSDGTDTFRIVMGLSDTGTVAATNAIWVEYTQATDTHWLGTVRAAGTSSVLPGPTVATTTYVRGLLRKYAGETGYHAIFDGADVGTLTTNQPTGTALAPTFALTKSAGTTARTADFDYIKVTQAWPNGRGL